MPARIIEDEPLIALLITAGGAEVRPRIPDATVIAKPFVTADLSRVLSAARPH